MHNACIGGLGNTSSLPIVMVNVVFETTPFWALGVYGRILKAPIPQYTAVYSGVYGRTPTLCIHGYTIHQGMGGIGVECSGLGALGGVPQWGTPPKVGEFY